MAREFGHILACIGAWCAKHSEEGIVNRLAASAIRYQAVVHRIAGKPGYVGAGMRAKYARGNPGRTGA
jgi:hypothetical protein